MSRGKKANTVKKTKSSFQRRVLEAVAIAWLAFAGFLVIALATYSHGDPAWSQSTTQIQVHNAAGRVGAWVADVLLYLFGYAAYLFPLVVVRRAVDVWKQTTRNPSKP